MAIYSVGLVLDSRNLLAKFTALHIWGEETGFEIQAVCTDIKSLNTALHEKEFDLLIIENKLVISDDYKVLRTIINNKSCRHIALCSADGDFASARNAFVLGIDDFFTLPFDKDIILSLFNRIKTQNKKHVSTDYTIVEKLLEMFVNRDDALYGYVEQLYNSYEINYLIDETVKIVFERNDWLDLYANENNYTSLDHTDSLEHKDNFISLYESYKLLLPNHSDILNEVIHYILYNPENDLRQKAISEELRINKSYLSTIFIAQTGIRFVDYITGVKLLRATWLLRNTDMKVNEIANRLDYKDVAYFSKQFKKYFGVNPSEYRIPDNYHFEI